MSAGGVFGRGARPPLNSGGGSKSSLSQPNTPTGADPFCGLPHTRMARMRWYCARVWLVWCAVLSSRMARLLCVWAGHPDGSTELVSYAGPLVNVTAEGSLETSEAGGREKRRSAGGWWNLNSPKTVAGNAKTATATAGAA
eukprot:2004999-Rhodomonas_salina.2